MSSEQKVERTVSGRVTSDKRQVTRTVVVEWAKRHPRYGKVERKKSKCHVHDPNNLSKLGDLVEIKQIRPISKTKTWQLVQVIEQA
jgi:small subunit ribosomal protein S17